MSFENRNAYFEENIEAHIVEPYKQKSKGAKRNPLYMNDMRV